VKTIDIDELDSPREVRADYEDFVRGKLSTVPATGYGDVAADWPHMFPFQRDVCRWALRRGRAAAFLDTGLGKSRIQLTWADEVARREGKPVIILAPLAVASQTVAEGARVGIGVTLCREAVDVRPGVNIINYDRMHKLDMSQFAGVVLDESSIIKSSGSSTLAAILEAFAATPFRLACTATPSPNDYTELGTHAEFLGVCTKAEMLAEYFCHDGGETSTWRLKGHAREAFWRWVAGWAAMVRMPSDLGYPDDGYALPELRIISHVIPADHGSVKETGLLFANEARTLTERRAAKKGTMGARVRACAALVNAEASEPWVVWADLNAEGDELERACDDAIQVAGADDVDTKEARLVAFAEGRSRVLVSKVKICGWGLNWQHCARMAFVGVNDSFEAFYQAVRRCYRFGQTREVEVHVFSSELEGEVTKNLSRKRDDAKAMGEELAIWTRDAVQQNVTGQDRQTNEYAPGSEMLIPAWLEVGA